MALNLQFHIVVIVIITSQMAARKNILMGAVIENVRTFVTFFNLLTVKSLIYTPILGNITFLIEPPIGT